MTSKLVEIIAHFALFLEFADESVLELEVAVKQQEDLAFRLQQLSPTERAEFVRTLAEIAGRIPEPEHRKYLDSLPRAVGIA
jgi:hypothetical protein